MRRPVWRWLTVVTLASLLLPVLAAGPSAAEPMDARGWLARIRSAALHGNYQGTMVVSAGGALSSSRVAHFCVGEQSYERLEALDGRQQRVYRFNDAVHTLWPQSRLAVVETRATAIDLPSATQAVDPRALEQYDLHAEGSERIAGREAQVFLLQPRDTLRYAQRLWVDKASGLMLRADVISASRSVLESAAFSEVEIGVRPQPEQVTQGVRKLDGYRVLHPSQQATQLDAEGWALERPAPGFRLAECVKRQLASADDEQLPVLQAVYSDGLTHVSLFIEPYDSKRAYADISGQAGATATLRQRRGDHWVTLMGDVPPSTLKAFADALQRRR